MFFNIVGNNNRGVHDCGDPVRTHTRGEHHLAGRAHRRAREPLRWQPCTRQRPTQHPHHEQQGIPPIEKEWEEDDGGRRERDARYIKEGSYVSQQIKKNKVTCLPSVSGVS